MDAEGERQWNSLIVPSVQELVKDKNITTVPPRYVRSDQDKVEIVDDSGIGLEIPVINMKSLCSTTTMNSELAKLDFACKEWGFFQLVNHGIEPYFLDNLKAEIQDFFNFPTEEKKKFWQRSGEIEGFGQVFVVSEDQKLDWGDSFFLTTQPVRLRKPSLLPKLPIPLRDLLDTYSTEVKNLTKILLAKMAIALKIKPEEIEDWFEDLWQSIRMNYYPPCPEPDKVIGLTHHSDVVALTILLQMNEVEGLQIKKDGKWVPIKPLPNALVVNVGDSLEIITNGIYRSIEHRAMVNTEKERISVAVFHSPGLDTRFGPTKSLVERLNNAFFKSVNTEEYFNIYFARELNGKSHLDLFRI
ncbi:PREDICTED: protein SRG1-like [Tarenaya hassleriana]|uniref:protein SRG1-like n=1 Tax=Tarenaya hassleriana TaxID=28532 RepID=UPI00053C983D|nr:PREDICTED: protein SRG1-like [Tarenaya hassleriana]